MPAYIERMSQLLHLPRERSATTRPASRPIVPSSSRSSRSMRPRRARMTFVPVRDQLVSGGHAARFAA